MKNKPTYDCHNKTYFEVSEEFENWLLLNSSKTPIDVITGNSENMKRLVLEYIKKHSFQYSVPLYNNGMIIVY